MASGSVTEVTVRDQEPSADLRLKLTSSGGEDATMTSSGSENDTLTSFGDSGETASDSQPMSPGSDASRNLAVDYMKTKYEKEKKPKKEPIVIPKLIREPKKLDIHWDKVVDEKLKRSQQAEPVLKEQDLVAMMLTFAGLDSGKSQYMSLVENSGRDPEPVSASREPIEKVGPPEITKTVRNMFETGKITDIDDLRTRDDTFDARTGSGVFENEPVRSEGVSRESDFNEEADGVQRGLTRNLLDHWNTKLTDDASKPTPKRRAVLTEGDGEPSDGTRQDDASGKDDHDWEVSHIEKGLTKSLMSQWSTIGSKEFKPERGRINVADAEGKVLESHPKRRNDVIRSDDVIQEGETVQKGLTKTLLSQWSAGGTAAEAPIERKRINVACAEGRVAENEPTRRSDVVRESDANFDEGNQVEKGLTKSLLHQWSTKDKASFAVERREINVAEDEGRVAESEPVRRSDVVSAFDTDESDVVQKGTTRSLLEQWKTKGSDAHPSSGTKGLVVLDEAEGVVAENEPVRRADVARESDTFSEEVPVERGTTRNLLNQWQNKRGDEAKSRDRTPINVAEAEAVVAENEPVRRADVARESDTFAEEAPVQRGTTRNLLNQWQNKRADDAKSRDRTPINVAEAEAVVAENEPVRRADVARESDTFAEEAPVQRGTTRNLLNQWQNKRGDDVKSRDRTPINVAEAEAVVAENEPTRRSDVARENDLDHSDTDRIQTGTTRSLLNQWQNRRPEFTKDKTPIVIDEGEGAVAENDPVKRTDVAREDDAVIEGEVLPRGLTKSILNQWSTKSTQGFSIDRKPISVAEDEGTVAENEPVRRSDVVRADDDARTEGDQIQRGTTKGLMEKWTSRGSEEFRTTQKNIRIAEDDGRIAENQPERRDDLIRECEDQTGSEVEVQKGFTKQLLSQWTVKGSEGFKAPKRQIVIAEGDGIVAENDPSPRHDVVREFDGSGESEQVQQGLTKKLLGEWKNKGSQDCFRAPRKEIVIAEDEGFVAENNPTQRSDIVKETALISDDADKIQKGTTNYLLGQWKNKGNVQFKAPKSEINLAEDEGVIAESTPVQRNDIVREYDRNVEEETVQKGFTKSLLGQWKNKGNEQYKATRKEIVLAEDEGTVAESQPIERSDVVKEDYQNLEGESVQKGFTKALLGQWKNKGSEEFRAPKREIVVAEDDGKVVENHPKQRSDVAREYDSNQEGEEIQRGYTKSLLGQWKNKGTEEYRAPKKEIILAEDEGKVAENQPVQRKDISRECDTITEGDTIQRGYTKNLLGQWKNKGNEEFRVPRKEIILAEDEGKIAESQPVYRSDVVRANDETIEGEKIQKGYTKNLLGQWKNKGKEEFQVPRKEIILAEDEGKIAESQPVHRSDVAREYDENIEGERIQKGYTKNLLGQWKNKGKEEFTVPRKEIILAEDEGKIAESQPVYRSDVAREYDENIEGEKIQKGYTKNLLGQWKNKGNEGYRAPKKEIVLAEAEGKIAENVPTQRDDVAREDDQNSEGDRVKRGITKNLLGQWKNKGNEEFRAARKEIILAEDEGRIAESEPIRRPDVVRECDFLEEGERIRRGTTQNLLSEWKTKGNREFKNPRRPIVIAEDEGRICESEPVQRTDTVRELNADSVQELPRSGQTKNLKAHWMSPREVTPTRRNPVNMIENDSEPCVVENNPVVRIDVVRERDNSEEVCLQRGFARDLAGYWQNTRETGTQKEPFRLEMDMSSDDKTVHENSPIELQGVTKCEGPQEEVMGKRGHIQLMTKQFLESNVRASPGRIQQQVNLDLADGPTVLENHPVVRSDVIREIDQEPDVISIAQARNTRELWSNMEQKEDRTAIPETFREPVRFTPPRELTPPPVHQEDFKSYQSITLSSGPTSSSSSASSQSRRSAPLGGPVPHQNHSNVSRSTLAFSVSDVQVRGGSST